VTVDVVVNVVVIVIVIVNDLLRLSTPSAEIPRHR